MKFSNLQGKTIVAIRGCEKGSESVDFICSDLTLVELRHQQDCCEHVRIEDVTGDPADLVGQKVMVAEETSNSNNPPPNADSFLWTFYKIRTHGGDLTIRWLGESNGYYSERVDVAVRTLGIDDLTPEEQVLRDLCLERAP